MTGVDRLGRRREARQHRGLRPLFPKLPADILTRALRVAMSEQAWRRLDELAEAMAAPTRPRAIGAVIERALQPAEATPAETAGDHRRLPSRPRHGEGRPSDSAWLSWQAQKEQRLLGLH